MEDSGVVKDGFCPCKGGLDGKCRHIAAVLFDLEHTARINNVKSCTSSQCQWVRRSKPNTNFCLLQELKITKSEYGKDEKVHADINKFDPRSIIPDVDTMNRQLREGLQQVCSSAVGLHVLSHCPPSTVDEDVLQSFITLDENVESVEEVEAVEIFTISDIRDNFVSLHNIQVSDSESVDTQLVSQFFEAISLTQEQADMINEKTKGQGEAEFWSKQRVGRLTASNFYKICHLRESTNKDNTLKELLNYCPLPAERTPVQFQWGHDKEQAAIDLYTKKFHKKHQGLCVKNSGLEVNTSWPHLGASPDGIRYCECCGKRVVEIKSLFSKRNLPPHIAASEYITKVNGKYQLKTETRWYYQIQEELATTCLKNADLIIYTNRNSSYRGAV
ncbi:uncharacterized protein LOC144648492 isoform X1 [Oculina patagonica]